MNQQLPLSLRLRDGADFDGFVDGENGALVAQLRQLSSSDSTGSLYLWGVPSSGRTHLAEASVRQTIAEGRSACLLPATEVLPMGPAVLEGMESFSLLVVDDLQILAGSPDWEIALFHLFNRCRDVGASMLFTADAPPASLGLELADLRSRLAAGPVFRLHALDEDGLKQMLIRRAGRRGLELPDEVASFIIRRGRREPGALLDVLEHLDQRALAEQRRLTVPFAKQVLGW